MDSNSNDTLPSTSQDVKSVQSNSVDNMNKGHSQVNLSVVADNQSVAPRILKEEGPGNMADFVGDLNQGSFAKSKTLGEDSLINGLDRVLILSDHQDLPHHTSYPDDKIRIVVHNQLVKKKKSRLSQDDLGDLNSILNESHINLNKDSIKDGQVLEHNNLEDPFVLQDEVSREAVAPKPKKKAKKDISTLILDKSQSLSLSQFNQVIGDSDSHILSDIQQIDRSSQEPESFIMRDLEQAPAIILNYSYPSNYSNLKINKSYLDESYWTNLKIKASTDPVEEKLRAQIADMLEYFLRRFGQAELERKWKEQEYAKDIVLSQLFYCLQRKFAASGKCREDMMRYAVRKMIITVLDNERYQANLSEKEAAILLIKKYSLENGFYQRVTGKPPGMNFFSRLFSSRAFCLDFEAYLEHFDEITSYDNERKILKMIDFLFSCVKQDTMGKIQSYKRLPWLNVWIERTKMVAKELLERLRDNDNLIIRYFENLTISSILSPTISISSWSIIHDFDGLQMASPQICDLDHIDFEEEE